MSSFLLFLMNLLFPYFEKIHKILSFYTILKGKVKKVLVDSCWVGHSSDDFDNFWWNPWWFILKDLFEDILTKLDFSLLESQMSKINFKFEILIRNRSMLIIIRKYLFNKLMIFGLCKYYKPINNVIVKNLNLMLIMLNKKIK